MSLLDWDRLASQVLDGAAIRRDQARAVLAAGDDELLPVLQAAFRVRRRRFGRDVHVHLLRNAESGVCSEDCAFCSQSTRAVKAGSGVRQYPIQSVDELMAGARRAAADGAARYCMVTATRGPSAGDLEVVCETVRRIKRELPGLGVCTSLGLLAPGQAEALAAAGVDRFNHNLETSRRRFGEVCTTHAWEDRAATLRAAKAAGMEACCGGILGMGEDLDDRVDLAFELLEIGVASVPVNLLDPRPGTPLHDQPRLSPADALRALAMFRLVHPDADVRIAGGREKILGPMQPLALYPANSLFIDGYLTTGGQGAAADRAMIEAAGFRMVSEAP